LTDDQVVERVWAKIPDMLDCKGLCHDSCTVISLSDAENTRIFKKHGFNLSGRIMSLLTRYRMVGGEIVCPALDKKTKRCTIYEDRPFVCRLFGTTKTLRCQHGCRPKKWLDPFEAIELQQELEKLSEPESEETVRSKPKSSR